MLNCFDGDVAGDLSAFVTAHSIGDYREPAYPLKNRIILGLPISVAVFVVLALAADISQSSDFNSRTKSH